MRIPFPERFRLKHVIVFVIVMAAAQQVEGTNVTFTLLTAAYSILFALAFNAGSGMNLLAGSFIFFNGVQSALLGLIYKILIGEPGERNLISPNLTMGVYCVGMAAMGIAAFFSSRVIVKPALLSSMTVGDNMKKAAIGCLVCGVAAQFVIGTTTEGASFGSALAQVNHFNQMAIILGTTYQITHSKGKSSSNWIVWSAGLWIFFLGIISFSKEGMFTPIVAWLLSAAVLRYEFSKKQVILGGIAIFFLLYYLVPYSQYGRVLRTDTNQANYVGSFALLSHPQETRDLYNAQQEDEVDHGGPHLYDTPQGIMDREQMLGIDDALITYTDQGNVATLLPLFQAFGNAVPHVLWNNKQLVFTGNDYAREIGVLPQEDDTTGIAFSPVADAFHEATWFGATVVMTLLFFAFFTVGDSLAGDTRKSPWGLLLAALSAHVAAEGLLGGAVYIMTFGCFAVVLIAFLARYVLPLAVNLMTGGERTQARATSQFTNVVQGSRINPLLRQADTEPTQL